MSLAHHLRATMDQLPRLLARSEHTEQPQPVEHEHQTAHGPRRSQDMASSAGRLPLIQAMLRGRADGASYYSAATNSERRSLPWVEVAMMAVVGALVAYLAVVSVRLRIDYFDSYQSLLSARSILDRNPTDYSIYHGILYPVLLLPATALGRVVGSLDVTFVLAHLSAILLFGALLVATFSLLRVQLGLRAALLGTTPPSLIPRMLGLGLTPVVVLLLFPIILYPELGRSSVVYAPRLFLHDLRLVRDAVHVNEGMIQNYRFIANSLTWPLVLVAIAGALRGWRTHRSATLFHGLWFILLFGAQTYAIGHKEARFLLPVFPSLYFFVAQGFAAIPALTAFLTKQTGGRRGLTVALVGALLAAPVV